MERLIDSISIENHNKSNTYYGLLSRNRAVPNLTLSVDEEVIKKVCI